MEADTSPDLHTALPDITEQPADTPNSVEREQQISSRRSIALTLGSIMITPLRAISFTLREPLSTARLSCCRPQSTDKAPVGPVPPNVTTGNGVRAKLRRRALGLGAPVRAAGGCRQLEMRPESPDHWGIGHRRHNPPGIRHTGQTALHVEGGDPVESP
jgi:hypothetical protein